MTPPPGLLLLHGAGDAGACWAPFVARLRAADGLADLRVATPDAPAHGGRRAVPGQTVGWPDLLADAVGNAEALVAETGHRIVVAGHSMGAMMALGVAAHRPDLVVATFLEDPPLLEAPPAAAAEPASAGAAELVDLGEFARWFAELQAQPLDQVVAAARADHPDWDDAEYEPWARAKQAVDVSAFQEPVSWLYAEAGWLLRHAPEPVVLVAGQPDLGSAVAPAAEAGLRALPGWTIHRSPTGHDVRRDSPAATTRLLADLIRSATA